MHRGTDVALLLKVILVMAIILIVRGIKETGLENVGIDSIMSNSRELVFVAVGIVILLVILDQYGGRTRF